MPSISAPAVVESAFLNGGRSTLQLSDTFTGGELRCRWDELTYADVNRFWGFWEQVSSVESFRLPPEFWPSALPAGRKHLYQRMNPSGLWRFKGKPVVDDHNYTTPFIEVILEGVLS